MRACCVLLVFCLLSGCGAAQSVPEGLPAPGETAEPEVPPTLAEDEEPALLVCRIVDGAEDGDLLLAELEGGGVYRLDAGKVPVYLDGGEADASALEDGMSVEVRFSGEVEESFPARLGEAYSIAAWSRERNGGGTLYDLCGLYLQVLDDLWEKDPALNENISLAGLDLSGAPGGLTESEKAALAWRFGELHGVEVLTGTFEELEAQGRFTASAVSTPAPKDGQTWDRTWNQWEDGCLFSIAASDAHEDEACTLPVLFFHAEKWRGPLAAYCFYDCSAMWPECGTWSGYQVRGEMIA